MHLAAIFCEKKSETVAKHRVTRLKITLFRLAIPKMAGVWKKSGIFAFFGLLARSFGRNLAGVVASSNTSSRVADCSQAHRWVSGL